MAAISDQFSFLSNRGRLFTFSSSNNKVYTGIQYSTLKEYDKNRVRYWIPVYTLLFEHENVNSTSVTQKTKLIPILVVLF